MMHFTDKTILITGGNSGIGRALAESLQARGNRIIITGRSETSLRLTLEANPDFVGYQLDVTDATALQIFADWMLSDHPDLDVVILNAGIMEREDLTADAINTDVALRTIATNLTAPLLLSAALLPALRARPDAALITISSGLAFVPRADSPTYSATKAAIHSWTQGLRHQLRDTNVSVLEIAPPLVATELTPGQSGQAMAMPLADFVAEVIEKLDTATQEVLVDRVLPQRQAEINGNFDAIFARINPA